MVKLRVDSRYRLGVLENTEYSPYTCMGRSLELPPSPGSPTKDTELNGVNMVQLNCVSPVRACRTLILALEKELGMNKIL